jgi:hypothetical protein
MWKMIMMECECVNGLNEWNEKGIDKDSTKNNANTPYSIDQSVRATGQQYVWEASLEALCANTLSAFRQALHNRQPL